MLRTVLFIALLALPGQALASAAAAGLDGASQRGAATFRFLGLPLYEARLYTKGGKPLSWSEDFGLELRYLRNVSQNDIVEGTMRELDRTGGALPIRGELQSCFSSVSRGDRYLAVTDGPNRIGFWLNGQKTCTLSHPNITQRFMGIFLGDNTRSRTFTRALLGQ